MTSPLVVREIPIGKLLPAVWNANRVDEKGRARLRRSIEQFGIVENLVVRVHPERRGFYEVLGGNHRLEEYRALGVEVVPCHVVKVDDARARLLSQALNQHGENDPDAYRVLMTTVLAQVEAAEVIAAASR